MPVQIMSSFPPKQSSLMISSTENNFSKNGGEGLMQSSLNQIANSTLAINKSSTGSLQGIKVNKVLNDSLDINSGCGINKCTPSDNQIGVGTNHILQMVNVAGKIWDKNNGSVAAYFSLKDFFLTKNDAISDPYVSDQESGRWFASIFDVSTESYHIAVSNTDDPMKMWTIYNLASFDSCPDQGKFAVTRDLFVISVNDFGKKCSNGFKGVQYTIASKSDMINGANTVMFSNRTLKSQLIFSASSSTTKF